MRKKYNTKRNSNWNITLRGILTFTVIMLGVLLCSCASHVQIKLIDDLESKSEKYYKKKYSERYFSEGDTYFTISYQGDRVDEFYVPNLDWQNKRFVLNIFAIEWDEIPNNWAEEIVDEFCQQFEEVTSVKIEYDKGETEVGTLPTIKDTKWKFPYGLNMNSIHYQYDNEGVKVVGKSIVNPNIMNLKNIVEVQVYLPVFMFDQERNKKVISYLANVVFLDTEKYLYKRSGRSVQKVILPYYAMYTGKDNGVQKIPDLENLLIKDLNMDKRDADNTISGLRRRIGKYVDKDFENTIKNDPHPADRRRRLIDYAMDYDIIRARCYSWVLSNRLVESRDSYLLNITGWTKITKGESFKYATIEPIPILRALYYGDEVLFTTKKYCKDRFHIDDESGHPYGSHKLFTNDTAFPNWTFKGYGNYVAVLGKIHNIDEMDVNSAMGIDAAFRVLAEKYKERMEWVKAETSNEKYPADLFYFPSDKYNIEPGVALRNFDINSRVEW